MGRGDISLSPPRKVSDGARKVIKKIPWSELQKFFRVYDLETDTEFYGTTVEARVHCGASLDGFKRAVKARRLLKGRYKIEPIPRFLFIKKTGRSHDEQWSYYWRW